MMKFDKDVLLDSSSKKTPLREERVKKAIDLAAHLLEETTKEKTKKEKEREKKLSKLIQDPIGKTFLTRLMDEAFRSSSEIKTADQIHYLIKKFGIPSFLDEKERMKFLLFLLLGKKFPHFFVRQIKKNIFTEMAAVLLPQDPQDRAHYFKTCKEQNVRININHLGEAILGEQEAERRVEVYLKDLEDPQIEYVSIKISTIFSQINQVGWDNSLEMICLKLRRLYIAAKDNFFTRKDGSKVSKFVNLDMEEYKDLHLTVAAFQKVLSEPEFLQLNAGIVLQSYIPDSFLMQKKLTEWAMEREKRGGTSIKIRIVKGANMAMEMVESSLKGWPRPTYEKKVETDANFKRMLEYAADQTRAQAVHIGVGSHNLFDIAYALTLRTEKNLEKEMEIEMLQGMAEPMRRAVQNVSHDMLLYSPDAKSEDFQNAVAYLIRRLDENSGPENFLRDIFDINPANVSWEVQKNRFLQSLALINSVSEAPMRTQNRFEMPIPPQDTHFHNECDTDFSLENNRRWAQKILNDWEKKSFPRVPLVIGGQDMYGEEKTGMDPSRPTFPLFSYSLADHGQIELAVRVAKKEEKNWQNLSFQERSNLLEKVAQNFREQRSDLIGAMVANTAKTIWEADTEVSEAIDFIEYYRKNWEKLLSLPDVSFLSKGTLLVTPPWNFPCSIPTGSIAAALTAGNCVLFKPAPEAVLVGWTLVNLFWKGGIPKEVLHFLNCDEDTGGNALIQHPDVNGVLLTGATSTALKFMQLKPGIDLNAETGGKNAIIITSLSDRDLAIKDLIQSSFSHAGQKCSACSLAILEADVYDDPHFMKQLKDATESLYCGSAWVAHTKVPPLIRPPGEVLKRGLTKLENGESWLVEPKNSPDNPHLWTCGIKLGVKPGSFMHQTELFGPVLGVMRAGSLKEAIEFANATPYGLTSGLHSLDEREHLFWKERIVAGNLYINRTITGAIVQRQPFGGCKASSFGPEAKAGGPNYVLSLTHVVQTELPKEKHPLPAAILPLMSALKSFDLGEEDRSLFKKSCESYSYWAPLLKKPEDVSKILGQDNFFYHVPREKAVLRVQEKNSLAILQVLAACLICGTPLEVSSSVPFPFPQTIPGIQWTSESEEGFMNRMSKGRIRVIGQSSQKLLEKAASIGSVLQSQPVLANGRIELLHYLREVSLSIDYHRYGYLGLREGTL